MLRSPAELGALRDRLRRLLATIPGTRSEREAIVLATVEAADNALLACPASDCRIEVIVSLIADYVCIEVRDSGAGVRGACLNPGKLVASNAEHGRGLYLMDQLMESLELVPRERGTLVRMTKRLRDEDAGADQAQRAAC